MLKEGTLPPGYTVKKRKLVKVASRAARRGEGRLSGSTGDGTTTATSSMTSSAIPIRRPCP